MTVKCIPEFARVPLVIAALSFAPSVAAGQETQWAEIVARTSASLVVIETDTGQGSGFFVRSDGTLVTNNHVVDDATKIAVHTASGEIFRGGFVLTSDQARDLAIVRVDGFDLPFATVGNSNEVRAGVPVLLMGAPRGLEQSVSSGLIAAVRMDDDGTKLLQTSAPASPGSSGGPLLNSAGEVIGVLSFTVAGSQNLNFAVPINYARGLLDRLTAVANQAERRLEPLTPSAARAESANARSTAEKAAPSSPRSPEDALSVSKTIYVVTNDSRIAVGAATELRKWGQFTQVARASDADLILQIDNVWENNAGNGRGAAQLIDRATSEVIWAGTRGGVFTGFERVGRQIIEDIQKAFRKVESTAPSRP